MTQAEVKFREVTKETFRPVAALSVADDQKNFVSNNAFSMAEASFEEGAWYRAIYADDTPVGFAMLFINEEKAEYGLWRFMIDKEHQGKGYGREALQLVVDHIKSFPNATKMELSVVPENKGAIKLYESFGFKDTGRVEWDENVYELIF
ncbi:MAG: GNAT family N-acetyltransferase [Chloroflexota bacterium]